MGAPISANAALRATVNAVIEWQTSGKFHPLTCGTDSRHELLQPKVLRAVGQGQDRVILVCPTCFYAQSFIPDVVLTAHG